MLGAFLGGAIVALIVMLINSFRTKSNGEKSAQNESPKNWICPKCGKENSYFFSRCDCGHEKPLESETAGEPSVQQKPIAVPNTPNDNKDETLLSIIKYLLYKHKTNKNASILKNNYVCVDFAVAATTILKQTKSIKDYKLFDDLFAELSKHFPINNTELRAMILSRTKFYQRTLVKKGIDSLINEILLIVPYDLYNNKFVEYSEDSPLMLLDIEKKMFIDIEGRATIMVLIDIINGKNKLS